MEGLVSVALALEDLAMGSSDLEASVMEVMAYLTLGDLTVLVGEDLDMAMVTATGLEDITAAFTAPHTTTEIVLADLTIEHLHTIEIEEDTIMGSLLIT